MENLILCDTDVLINFLGGREGADEVEALLNTSRAAVSAITVYELFNGVVSEKHLRQRDALVQLCEVVKIDAGIARRGSEIYRHLKGTGSLVCHEDVLIAATALETGTPLLTANRKHFERIPGLRLHPIS